MEMDLDKGILGPKPKVTNIKSTNLQSLSFLWEVADVLAFLPQPQTLIWGLGKLYFGCFLHRQGWQDLLG